MVQSFILDQLEGESQEKSTPGISCEGEKEVARKKAAASTAVVQPTIGETGLENEPYE